MTINSTTFVICCSPLLSVTESSMRPSTTTNYPINPATISLGISSTVFSPFQRIVGRERQYIIGRHSSINQDSSNIVTVNEQCNHQGIVVQHIYALSVLSVENYQYGRLFQIHDKNRMRCFTNEGLSFITQLAPTWASEDNVDDKDLIIVVPRWHPWSVSLVIFLRFC